MENQNRELSLRMEDAENQLTEAVERVMAAHGLPCFLLEPIMAKVYQKVQNAKDQELAQARLREKMQTADKEDGK